MGKPTRKIIETLVLPLEPVRYLVTNTERIILVTYDYKFAKKIESAINALDDAKNYYLKLR